MAKLFLEIKMELDEYFNEAILEYLKSPDEIHAARDDILGSLTHVLTSEALRELSLKTCITDLLIAQALTEKPRQ